MPSIEKMEMTPRWIFQQDSAPCHTANIVKEWFKDNDVPVMQWPAQSPDLNPIGMYFLHMLNHFHCFSLHCIHSLQNHSGLTSRRRSMSTALHRRKISGSGASMSGSVFQLNASAGCATTPTKDVLMLSSKVADGPLNINGVQKFCN